MATRRERRRKPKHIISERTQEFCQQICRSGENCKNRAKRNSSFCGLHAKLEQQIQDTIRETGKGPVWDEDDPDYEPTLNDSYDLTVERRCFRRGITPHHGRPGDVESNIRRCMNCGVSGWVKPTYDPQKRKATCPAGMAQYTDDEWDEQTGVLGCCRPILEIKQKEEAPAKSYQSVRGIGDFRTLAISTEKRRQDFVTTYEQRKGLRGNIFKRALTQTKMTGSKVSEYLDRKLKRVERAADNFWNATKYRTDEGLAALIVELVLQNMEKNLYDPEDDLNASAVMVETAILNMTDDKETSTEWKKDALLAYSTELSDCCENTKTNSLAAKVIEAAGDSNPPEDSTVQTRFKQAKDLIKETYSKTESSMNEALGESKAFLNKKRDEMDTATKVRLVEKTKTLKSMYKTLSRSLVISYLVFPIITKVIGRLCVKLQNFVMHKALAARIAEGESYRDDAGKFHKRPLTMDEMESFTSEYVSQNLGTLNVLFMFWLDDELATNNLFDYWTENMFGQSMSDITTDIKDTIISLIPGSGVIIAIMRRMGNVVLSIIRAALVKSVRDAIFQLAEAIFYSRVVDMEVFFNTCLGDLQRFRGLGQSRNASLSDFQQGLFSWNDEPASDTVFSHNIAYGQQVFDTSENVSLPIVF